MNSASSASRSSIPISTHRSNFAQLLAGPSPCSSATPFPDAGLGSQISNALCPLVNDGEQPRPAIESDGPRSHGSSKDFAGSNIEPVVDSRVHAGTSRLRKLLCQLSCL